jgi:hypothetical protein
MAWAPILLLLILINSALKHCPNLLYFAFYFARLCFNFARLLRQFSVGFSCRNDSTRHISVIALLVGHNSVKIT